MGLTWTPGRPATAGSRSWSPTPTGKLPGASRRPPPLVTLWRSALWTSS
nr:MAG TPA: hypothetical protein [Caudoviricetes sp.]